MEAHLLKGMVDMVGSLVALAILNVDLPRTDEFKNYDNHLEIIIFD